MRRGKRAVLPRWRERTGRRPCCHGARARLLARPRLRELGRRRGARGARAHELEIGMSGAPVCSDTMGTPPRRSDSGWLQMFIKSPRMTSAWNACARRARGESG